MGHDAFQRAWKNAHSVPITDAVAQASPVLKRMRLDGVACVKVPYAESDVQAWLGGPQHTNMDSELLVKVIKVCLQPTKGPKLRNWLCLLARKATRTVMSLASHQRHTTEALLWP